MNKSLTVALTAAFLATSIAAPKPAEARGLGVGIGLGILAVGAIAAHSAQKQQQKQYQQQRAAQARAQAKANAAAKARAQAKAKAESRAYAARKSNQETLASKEENSDTSNTYVAAPSSSAALEKVGATPILPGTETAIAPESGVVTQAAIAAAPADAAMQTEMVTVEAVEAKAEVTEPSANVGCKRFIPEVGVTVTVGC